MGRLYTIDQKLLTDTPEIRIGDSIFPVDDRQKTAKKIMAIMSDKEGKDDLQRIEQVVALALGEKAAETIDEMNLPFKAQQAVYENVISAVLGEDPEELKGRFQEPKQTK